MTKEDLVTEMQKILSTRLDENTIALNRSYESMTGESKSSAGDKFETTRAILQSEQDRIKAQIIKIKADKSILKHLKLKEHETIQLGSIVNTEAGVSYFVSIGLGKIKLNEKVCYAISPVSPIGQLLIGRQAGDLLTFNNKSNTITTVK